MLLDAQAPSAGDELAALGDRITVLADAAQVGGAFEVFTVTGPRDSGPPPHAHDWAEAYLVLDGEVLVSVDGSERVLGAGAFGVTPAEALHSYRILTETARFLLVTSTDRASRFFADLDVNVPAGEYSPEKLPTVIEVAKRNGLSSPIFD
jgi:quercetin dioxygenase-like cupin family protein